MVRLWELLISKNPVTYTTEDLEEYGESLIDSNSMKFGNDPNATKPKSG